MKKTFLSIVFLTLLASCGSNEKTTTSQESSTESQGRQIDGERQRPNPETMFAEMDVNKDGKLSKEEVKGPLAEKFAEIDSNKDGFISKEELKNAPKPERQGGGQGGRR